MSAFGSKRTSLRPYRGLYEQLRCFGVEAGRAWMGNAVYRDLVQAMVMVDLKRLILAVPMSYKYLTGGRPTVSKDYENMVSVADDTRIGMPYSLTAARRVRFGMD